MAVNVPLSVLTTSYITSLFEPTEKSASPKW